MAQTIFLYYTHFNIKMKKMPFSIYLYVSVVFSTQNNRVKKKKKKERHLTKLTTKKRKKWAKYIEMKGQRVH